MQYPRVLSEQSTVKLLQSGFSIARFGDGELRIAVGGSSVSQKADPKLAAELCAILKNPHPSLLAAIPNFMNPKFGRKRYFAEYTSDRYVSLYSSTVDYGSTFITRPECAPWIDTPDYWEDIRSLWRGKDIVYVGGELTLAQEVQWSCRTLYCVAAPKRDAYSVIDHLEREVLAVGHKTCVISLGAAGTALAARLAKRGVHAMDLGHVGMFLKNPGAYAMDIDQLATPEYRKLLNHAHETTNWGRGGYSWAPKIAEYARKIEAGQVLDYGCGGGTLKPALESLGVKCMEYDPGVPGKDIAPKLADLVVSTDVFEHIEPDLVDNVLKHTFLLARKAGFFAIAKQPAKKVLADGRNAHLTCQPTEWWVERLKAAGWTKVKVREDQWKKCLITCEK